ncbi:MAG: hypothetical protein IPO91_06035 [Chloroflexi bacterium]|nr:hypothetical protein [Chloroflexota bacterium]
MLHRYPRFTVILLALLALTVLGAIAAQAQCEECESAAYIADCSLIFESTIPDPPKEEFPVPGKAFSLDFAKPLNAPFTIYIKLYDGYTFITEQAVTGEPGTPFSVSFALTQFFEDEDVSILVGIDPGDSFGFIYWWLSIGGEGDAMPVPNSVVLACQQKTCDYPHEGDVQGTVLGSPLTYYEANLNAETIPAVVLRPDQTWWIVDARDGFYQVFITCGAPLVWVTADSLGPNFDDVWRGRPLPDAGTRPE